MGAVDSSGCGKNKVWFRSRWRGAAPRKTRERTRRRNPRVRGVERKLRGARRSAAAAAVPDDRGGRAERRAESSRVRGSWTSRGDPRRTVHRPRPSAVRWSSPVDVAAVSPPLPLRQEVPLPAGGLPLPVERCRRWCSRRRCPIRGCRSARCCRSTRCCRSSRCCRSNRCCRSSRCSRSSRRCRSSRCRRSSRSSSPPVDSPSGRAPAHHVRRAHRLNAVSLVRRASASTGAAADAAATEAAHAAVEACATAGAGITGSPTAA